MRPPSPLNEPTSTSSDLAQQQPTIPPVQPEKVGLLVTRELEKAIQSCKKKVDVISRDCRKRNRKFRDLSFDLEEDRDRCLHGLSKSPSYNPSDVLRVSDIFEKPEFFANGVSQSDIIQGVLGDCWFLSALATVSAMPSLVEKFCVARDEKVGVYGFIFYRDSGWVDVIIDDLLFVTIPKYESLSSREKTLYHEDKDLFNFTARKGGKCLYFARGRTDNQTWVPLVEKAYAKLHGDYASLSGGSAAESLEDLTGGVSTPLHMNDILDPDVFWEEELLKANEDRLFGCYLSTMAIPADWDYDFSPTVKGLYTGHAYSVLKAIEHNGKRFLRLRNPWGKSGWTGAWSDGSKEWTSEWLNALERLGYTFGDDGEFLMAFEDFRSTFGVIHRTKLFNNSWTLSSHWLEASSRKFPGAWNFGDVSFTFTMPQLAQVIIVLAQIDSRYFKDISGYTKWSFDFALFKRGEKDVVAMSQHTDIWARSVNLEEELEAGDYVVHVRFDRLEDRSKDYLAEEMPKWNTRKLAKVMSEASYSRSVAANFDPSDLGHHRIPLPLERYAGVDLTELEVQGMAAAAAKRKAVETDGALSKGLKAVRTAFPEDDTTIKASTASTKATADETDNETSTIETGTSNEAGITNSRPSGPPTDSILSHQLGKGMTEDDIKKDEQPADDCADQKQDPLEEHGKSGEEKDTESPVPVKDEAIPNTKSVEDPVHKDIVCDNCKKSKITGLRYVCLDALCRDFDLCEECYNKGAEVGVHKANHQMLPLTPEDTESGKVRDKAVKGDDNTVTVGLRVFTKDCQGTPVSIQGQLRHGRIISWAKPELDV